MAEENIPLAISWCFPSLVDGAGKGWLIVEIKNGSPRIIVAVNRHGHVFLPVPGEQVGRARWLVFRVYPDEAPFALRDEGTGRLIAKGFVPGGAHA